MLLVCLPFSTLAMLMFLKSFKGNRIEREHTSKKNIKNFSILIMYENTETKTT